MEKIAQDVGDIQSRLLDHRPVVNAEIRHFVKEFEEKHGHTDSRMLENINKMVLEINEQLQLPDFEAMAQQLSEVKKCLEAANHMTEKVQQRELEAQQSPQLQANMDRLKEERTEFLKKQQRLKEEIDEEHDKAVGELTTKYCEMQKELTKFSPF